MGSIAALLSYNGAADIDAARRMLRAAPHRGDLHEVAALGRCALAIGDARDRREGDIEIGEGLAIAFSGVLDNLAELAARLEREGRPPPAATPASVVLAAFRAWGADSVPGRLRGAFAAVVTDGTRLWAFRDQLAFRTLFYRRDARGVYVATEAKQVLAGAGLPRRPDLEVVERIFFSELLLDERPCALEGVQRLPKATRLAAGDSDVRLTRYWRPETLLESARLSDDEVRERFDELMTQAVARTLTGRDVVSLSGGIDSPAVAAFAAPEHLRSFGRPLEALSAVYPDQPSVDESRYIEAVASFLHIPLHTYVRRAQPLERLDEWVRLLDGPVPKILVSDAEEHYRHARRLGFSTMLTGEVAEFVFDKRGHLVPHLLTRGRLGPLWRHLARQRALGATGADLARQLASAFVPRRAATALRRVRLPQGTAPIPEWLDERRFRHKFAGVTGPTRNRWRQEQLWGFVGPGLTMESDGIIQELCGIRVRRPWADVDLWEFFLALPAQVKFPEPGRKRLVRRLLRGRVPDVVLDRRDVTGFEDSIVARADHEALRRWLVAPAHRFRGVDHDALTRRLHNGGLNATDYMWAKDLAAAYAFIDSCG